MGRPGLTIRQTRHVPRAPSVRGAPQVLKKNVYIVPVSRTGLRPLQRWSDTSIPDDSPRTVQPQDGSTPGDSTPDSSAQDVSTPGRFDPFVSTPYNFYISL